MVRLLTLLAVLGTALQACGAAAADSAAKSSSCSNFDDLPQNPGGFSPYQDPVGTYKSITYQGFNVATQKNAEDKFFHVPSQPNVINSNPITENLFGGTSALLIDTTATGKAASTFTLTSSRLACLVTNGESTSNYEGCTVLFVGNKPGGKKSVTYEYEYPNQNTNYTFGNGPLVDFGAVVLPNNFKGLTSVFLTITANQNDVVGVNILLDDVCVSVQK